MSDPPAKARPRVGRLGVWLCVVAVLGLASPGLSHAAGRTYHITRLNRGPMGFDVTGEYHAAGMEYRLRFPAAVGRPDGSRANFERAALMVESPALEVDMVTREVPGETGAREFELRIDPALLANARANLQYVFEGSGDREVYSIDLSEIVGPEPDRVLINPHALVE